MISYNQKKKAETFQAFHHADQLFVLPTIWNPGSAKIYEKMGFQALSTTSAGIAYSFGYTDGEKLPFELLSQLIHRIASRITVPLSVDMEGGYGNTGEEVQMNARQLIENGAVGLNLEDGIAQQEIQSMEVMKEKISALAQLKDELGLNFLINARTDLYWNDPYPIKETLGLAIERGNQYKESGADCIFIPGVTSYETIGHLVQEIDCPLHVLLSKEVNDIRRLNRLGVKRVSLGSGPARVVMQQVIEGAEKMHSNEFTSLLSSDVSYATANEFFDVEKKEPPRWGYQ